MRFVRAAATAIVIGSNLVDAIPLTRQTSGLAPCANITQQYQDALAANETILRFDGELAYDCLMSMPFNATLGAAFVAEVAKYLQFQSTIPFLKDPPSTYLSPAVDLLGGIEQIYQKANSSQYQSQYQMDTDLINLFNSANDGHLSAGFCSLEIFEFSQSLQLVSVSSDGVELPKLYTFEDAILLANGNTEVSDVVQINGQNATQYLENLGLTQNNQDPDAQWNNLFPSQAKLVAGNPFLGHGAFVSNSGLWPGSSEISVTFTNGSSSTARVEASIEISNFNYTTGEALFTRACIPTGTQSSGANSTSSSEQADTTASQQPTATAGPAGYPEPEMRDPYNLIIGYYLNGTYNDTAVLFIPSFETNDPPSLPDSEEATFAYVASAFVNQSLADGKTKMIIDVSGNGGGQILSGFDLFELFFPDIPSYSATRMRDHPAEQLMIKSISTIPITNETGQAYYGPFNAPQQVTPNQTQSFSTWDTLYGPDDIDGANMTALYANFNFTSESNDEDPIRGYGGVPLNVTGRPFKAENILIVSDGYCTSTCTTFVNLMTDPQFGGASALGFGGRPINAPMQAIGGTRGAQSMQWPIIYTNALLAYEWALNTTNSSTPALTADEIALFEEVAPISTDNFPLYIDSSVTNLNLRNSYNPNNDTTPLQFTYQPANCRLFYTFENVLQPATSWYSAYDAIWGNASCVSGSKVTNTTGY